MSESFLNKLARQVSTILLKMRLRHRRFSINFEKFPKTPFLQSTFERLLLPSVPCKQETCWWLIKKSAYVNYVDLNQNVLSHNLILSISLRDNFINTVILLQYFNTLPFDSSRAKTTCWRFSEITVNVLITHQKIIIFKGAHHIQNQENYYQEKCALN